MNRNWARNQNRERREQQEARYGQPSTTARPMLDHPHRALPSGKTWLPHCGKRQQARTLRQQRALALKQARKANGGASCITGVDPETGGLLLDFPTPVRATPSE